MTRQEQISRQANQIAMQEQQQRASQLSQQQQDRSQTRNDKTQTAADEKKLEPTDSEVQGGPGDRRRGQIGIDGKRTIFFRCCTPLESMLKMSESQFRAVRSEIFSFRLGFWAAALRGDKVL